MARSARLLILLTNIYTLWGRKRFLLPVTYFTTNLVHPFILLVTGIKLRLGAVLHKEVLDNSILHLDVWYTLDLNSFFLTSEKHGHYNHSFFIFFIVPRELGRYFNIMTGTCK